MRPGTEQFSSESAKLSPAVVLVTRGVFEWQNHDHIARGCWASAPEPENNEQHRIPRATRILRSAVILIKPKPLKMNHCWCSRDAVQYRPLVVRAVSFSAVRSK
jgi:hypothetical protein